MCEGGRVRTGISFFKSESMWVFCLLDYSISISNGLRSKEKLLVGIAKFQNFVWTLKGELTSFRIMPWEREYYFFVGSRCSSLCNRDSKVNSREISEGSHPRKLIPVNAGTKNLLRLIPAKMSSFQGNQCFWADVIQKTLHETDTSIFAVNLILQNFAGINFRDSPN